MHDRVYCSGLELTVGVGFHEAELAITQTVLVDLAIDCEFTRGPARDEFTGLVDYFVLVQHLERHVVGRRYALIEALAVDLARQVLRLYPPVQVRVKVTKRPLAMPQVAAVAVECVRSAADFAGE
ncbi:dihydroneopterin aldolase [Nannocystis sp. SCPEA4]|uniref:dihydroneopterin aldolase n=1 Tax=Nannocystis sp. SCPEA4 TaxID=2996787 RepID=UPI00226E02D7|nr:dihydroneopterin aldolase [Nannocystis sp. SCPEA4]MCY1058260.1 dihydroneopterin aldolase [Nannocystis sp. SCPEA4]